MGRRKFGLRHLIEDIEEELERMLEEEAFPEEAFPEEDLPEKRINKGLTEEEIRAKWKKLKWEVDAWGLKDLACYILCSLPFIIIAIVIGFLMII